MNNPLLFFPASDLKYITEKFKRDRQGQEIVTLITSNEVDKPGYVQYSNIYDDNIVLLQKNGFKIYQFIDKEIEYIISWGYDETNMDSFYADVDAEFYTNPGDSKVHLKHLS